MKLAIYLVLAIIWLLFLSEPTISFKPFSIEFGKPYAPFAWLFLIIAVVLFQTQARHDGFNQGVDRTFEIIREQLKEKNNEK